MRIELNLHPGIAPRSASAGSAPTVAPLQPDRYETTRTPTRGVAALARSVTTDTTSIAHRLASLALTPGSGVTQAKDLAELVALARRSDVPGAAQVKQVKFLMTGADSPSPTLYLIDTNTFSYHYDFYRQGLGGTLSLEQFNAQTYFKDQRSIVAGSLVLHESYESRGKKGLFAAEFWPTDPVKAPTVAKVMRAMQKALPFAKSKLAYHPAGNTQEQLLAQEKAIFTRLKIKTISSAALFKNVTYQPMNLGKSFGTLRILDSATTRPATARDIVLFKGTPPNELSHVAGIITETPQTPLSHINLKAKQNHTPNAFIKNASADPAISALDGKLVCYEVTADGPKLRAATQAEADAHFDKMRPKLGQKPPRDLAAKNVAKLADIQFHDAARYGVKACNVAELGRILPAGVAPTGFAVPFHFYDEFMKHNGLYDDVTRMLADAQFKADPAVRAKMLGDLQKKVKQASFPPALATDIKALQQDFYTQFGTGRAIRCRSSSNNEDLKGFNGAGLYDSFTHKADEGDLEKTIKQVYASLWNFRAFEERDFYRIDHLTAAMGVLVHPNEKDEMANGVAYTKNIVDPNWPGFYVNAQVGEQLVTNPGAGQTPDEFLISRIGPNGEYETQYISHSSEVKQGQTVLSAQRIDELAKAMASIQQHFATLYQRVGDNTFGMDIEFKIRKDGSLQVKQARPIVG